MAARLALVAAPVLSAVLFLAVSCSSPAATRGAEGAARTDLPCPVTGAAESPTDPGAATDLRQKAESGPLFAALARTSTPASCRMGDESGRLTIEYMFRNGGSLRVRHDARIEYDDQEAHFPSPPAEDAVGILRRAEQAAYGAEGCGIDWRVGETARGSGESWAEEDIYRGEACSCQARVRRDAAGRVVGLVLRSSC
jgi:hypothetical protein